MTKSRRAPLEEIRERLIAEAIQIRLEDIAINECIGKNGAPLIPDGKTVLTHCNAGALATAGYGTALGVIRAAVASGKKIDVFADETRPFLQGARLTVWELQHDHIPATLITDNMAGHFLHSGRIGCVVVGADRIAANGDVANKIGTYSVAVLAKENNVPFYVAAPISTLDLTLASGDQIPIEQRAAAEVTHVHGVPVAPEGTAVANPAFDVTPNRYVTAIITERGVARAPYSDSLAKVGKLRLMLSASCFRAALPRCACWAPRASSRTAARRASLCPIPPISTTTILQDYRGKVVLIDIMSTRCPHCLLLSTTLEQVKARYGDKVAILEVVLPPDNQDTDFEIHHDQQRHRPDGLRPWGR